MTERRLTPLSELQIAPLSWLWGDRIPRGAITLIDGDPGQGKSTILCDLAARLTTGRSMPHSDLPMAPTGVVLLQAEDHVGTTKASLEGAGADLRRVVGQDKNAFASRPFRLPDDLPLIEAGVTQMQASLVVIDPLSAFIRGHATVERHVRSALAPLAELAERTGVAVVILGHLNKGGSPNTIYRSAGSLAIIASARSALRVANDPSSDDPHRHLLFRTKSNLASAKSLIYRTLKRGHGFIIEWLGENSLTDRDLAGCTEPSILQEASYVLYSILSDGPVWAEDAIRAAGRSGISKRTLYRAKRLLGVVSRKRGSGLGSHWFWELPQDPRRLQAVKDKDLDELMERLCHGDNGPGADAHESTRDHDQSGGFGEDDDEEGDAHPQPL